MTEGELIRRQKISLAMKNRKITWSDKISKSKLGKKLSEEHKQNLILNHRGRTGQIVSDDTKNKIRNSLIGKERPEVAKKLKRYTQLEAIQNGRIHRWKKWLGFRDAILERDNYICKECKGIADTIHHIKPKKEFPELCWILSNVISLCTACHCKLEKPSERKI